MASGTSVEALHVPPIDDKTADTVEDAWRGFADAAALLDSAVQMIEDLLDPSAPS